LRIASIEKPTLKKNVKQKKYKNTYTHETIKKIKTKEKT